MVRQSDRSSGVHRATNASDASRYASTLLSGSPEMPAGSSSSLRMRPRMLCASRASCVVGSALGFDRQMHKTIDLNADLGEIDGDVALLETITSANIACGGHAGDESSMARALNEARQHMVIVGAHPSYPDRPGFG